MSDRRIQAAIAAAELDALGLFSLERDASLIFQGLTWVEVTEATRRSEAAWRAFMRWQTPAAQIVENDVREPNSKTSAASEPRLFKARKTPRRGGVAV